MKLKYLTILLAIFLAGCVATQDYEMQPDRDIIFQTSTVNAILEGFYDGILTYGEVKKNGDFGIGTFEGLDGEMIALDNEFYQIKADGVAYEVKDSQETPLVVVTFFDDDRKIMLKGDVDFETLSEYVDKAIPTKNIFYAIRIDGKFSYVRTRSVPKQEKPYPPLVEVTRNQPEFEFNDTVGTIVGFRTPEYANGINVPGYHLHFINEERTAGGHLLEFNIKDPVVAIDYTYDLHMVLPRDEEFYKLDLAEDKSEELEEAEK